MSLAAPIPNHQVAFKSILFATDLSPASLLALPFTSSIARHYHSKVFLIHIVPQDEYARVHTTSRGTLNSLQAAAEEGLIRSLGPLGEVDHQVLVDHGNVRSRLLAEARRFKVDLIVIGTHGWRGMKKFLRGSTAEEIASMASVPVLTVGPQVSSTKDFRHILYETDFSSASDSAVPVAFSLAEAYNASLFCLHVNDWDSKESPAAARPKTFEIFQEQIRRYSSGSLAERCRLKVEFGSRSERIVAIAATRQIDLIVLGSRSSKGIRARIAAHLPGSTAYEVISEVRCPVITVPG